MSFESLKRNSGKAGLEKLAKQMRDMSGGQNQNQGDDRFWQPTVDAAGNGSATIRFLPAPDGEEIPYVRLFEHGFKGPKGWYIERSLTTLGKDDPVAEFNSELWNASSDDDSPERKQARAQKRKLNYIANVLIIKDTANPANEGQVKLFKFGKKIFDKIMDKLNPEDADIEPVNVFNFWEGANFRLRIRKVDGYRNYDKSEFDSPSVLSEDDNELKEIYEKEHSLQKIVDPSEFKSYDELKARLYRVLDLSNQKKKVEEPKSEDEEDDTPKVTEPKKEKAAPAPSSDDDDDDAAEFFKNLVDEDD